MVARIISGKSIRGLLNYNENKVKAGTAQLLMASLFGTELDKLTFSDKLNRFQHLTDLNGHVKTNSMHIMLNFDITEKPNNFLLQQIATAYIDKIGFGEQPYLVYKHEDAAHPHIHIVTTNMQKDGSRINIHNIGRTLSETARKELEIEFGLVKAESKQLKNVLGIKPVDIEKALYGITPTKRAINNVVGAVTSQYKFTSIAELNAALKQFNVVADRGKEDTLMFQKKGLIYSILDDKGNKIGIPFKASSLNDKPTLANLEKKFAQNEEKRKPYKEGLKSSIEKAFKPYHQITRATFIQALQKQNIHTVFRQNEQGLIYGVTFVDNNNKTVFNGSDLGKAYGTKALTERFSNMNKLMRPTYLKEKPATNYLKTDEPMTEHLQPTAFEKLLQNLMGKDQPDTAPSITRKKRGKRKDEERGMHL